MAFTATVVLRTADIAARGVAAAHDLVLHEDGSRAVEMAHLVGLPWWRVALWVDADYSARERDLTIAVFRHRIELFYPVGTRLGSRLDAHSP
jgi:hypothetical protein